MRVIDNFDPASPVIRDVPDEIATVWLNQTDRFQLAPPEADGESPPPRASPAATVVPTEPVVPTPEVLATES